MVAFCTAWEKDLGRASASSEVRLMPCLAWFCDMTALHEDRSWTELPGVNFGLMDVAGKEILKNIGIGVVSDHGEMNAPGFIQNRSIIVFKWSEQANYNQLV